MAYYNNYTRQVTFAKARNKNAPLYMRVLKTLIDHPNGITREAAVIATHPDGNYGDVTCGWGCGPYTLLKDYGYATYERHGHTVLWKSTTKGIEFWHQMQISRDLIAA